MGSRARGDGTPQNILVAVDGSDESLAAVRWAAEEAVLRGTGITLMHVISPMTVTWPIPSLQNSYADWQDADAQRLIEQAQSTVAAALGDSAPPPVRAHIRHDGIVRELAAASSNATLLAVGIRGAGPIGGAALGSVTRGILHHAHCPVTVVKAIRPRSRDDERRPVLLGFDATSASEAAAQFAFGEADRRGVPLVALHAWCDVGIFGSLGSGWEAHAREGNDILSQRLAGWRECYPGVEVRLHVVCDRPARWLIDEARNAALVVVGTRGRGGVDGMLLGSVSASVVEFSPAPAEVVRAATNA